MPKWFFSKHILSIIIGEEGTRVCYSVHVEVRGELCGVDSLLPLHELQALNSGHQAYIASTFTQSHEVISDKGTKVIHFCVYTKTLQSYSKKQETIPCS